MTDSCTLPRTVTTKDTPHTMLPDMQQSQFPFSVAGCNIFTVTMALIAGERAGGHRMDQWPPVIQHKVSERIEDWYARNPTATVKAVTFAVADGCCHAALHWTMKV